MKLTLTMFPEYPSPGYSNLKISKISENTVEIEFPEHPVAKKISRSVCYSDIEIYFKLYDDRGVYVDIGKIETADNKIHIRDMRKETTNRGYIETGCTDFRIHNLSDLKKFCGFDVEQIQGYAELPQEQRELFDEVIIRFYNAQGFDIRKNLHPKSVNYVYEIEYSDIHNPCKLVGKDIRILKSDGKTLVEGELLSRCILDKNVDFKFCRRICYDSYLRFEFELNGKGGWYHITPEGEWY